jgi:hypothetical protein
MSMAPARVLRKRGLAQRSKDTLQECDDLSSRNAAA